MHDLDTIERLNERATQESVPRLRADGKYVVVAYAGLRLLSITPFDSAREAEVYFQTLKVHPDVRAELLLPLGADSAEAAVVKGRDQSEDRTLGDYVRRIEADDDASAPAQA